MLKRIHIKNFRSCKDVVLDNLGSTTALVGHNGSGKTNILMAIGVLAQSATLTDFHADRIVFLPPATTVTADFLFDDKLYSYSFGSEIDESVKKRRRLFLRESLAVQNGHERREKLIDRNDRIVRLTGRPTSVKINGATPCLPALTALLPDAEVLLEPIQRLLQFFRDVRYYPIDETNSGIGIEEGFSFVPADRYQKWLSEYLATGDAGNSVLMRLVHAYFERKPQFDELLSLLGSDGLDLLQEIEVRTIHLPFEAAGNQKNLERPHGYVVRFRPGKSLGGSGEPLTYGDLSLGTRRVIHLLTALILDDSGLKLIEHPEDGIHRGLVRKLISLLRTNADPAQIILTSHSAVVLNRLAAEDIRLVYTQRGSTKVRALTPKEIKAAAGYIDEVGTLAEFLETVGG